MCQQREYFRACCPAAIAAKQIVNCTYQTSAFGRLRPDGTAQCTRMFPQGN
jgi:hypothetical protein